MRIVVTRRLYTAINGAKPIRLFQYDICPFCCKLKAFLDWKKIPYVATDVNPISKSEIGFSKDYRKVPIVLDGDTQLNDSSHIMAELIKKYQQAGRIPSNFRDGTDPEIRKWLDFADKRLAVLLFPNITRNMFESWEAFGYINGVPHFNPIQKIVLRTTGALAMRLANGKIKKKYNIEDERSALMDVVDEWVRDGLAGKNFHGGEAPDLADVSVFGCLKSIQSFTTFASLVGEADRSFLVWFNRMKQEIGESSCVSRT